MGIAIRETDSPASLCLGRDEAAHCTTCRTRFLAVCGAFDAHELIEFDKIVQHRCFQPRATLFEQGEKAEFVFSVTDGVVRLFQLLEDGRRQIMGFALPGDFLGVSLPAKYGCSAEAVGLVSICRIPRAGFVALVDEKPHLLRKLHEHAGREIDLARDQMMLLGRRNAEERIATFLLRMRERWARLQQCSVTVPLPMSRSDIADYLGLTIETVSRTISKMARDKNIVVVPDGVRLLNIERLTVLQNG